MYRGFNQKAFHSPERSKKNVKTLSKEEERELFAKYQMQGDVSSRNAVIVSLIPLAEKIACNISQKYRQTQELDELKAIARLVLHTAAEGFSLEKGTRFSTYATKHITMALRQHCVEDAPIVRQPRTNNEKKAASLLPEFLRSNGIIGRTMNEDEIIKAASRFGVGPAHVKTEEFRMHQQEIALDTFTSSETGGPWALWLADRNTLRADEIVERKQCQNIVERAIWRAKYTGRYPLSDRDEKIYRQRFLGDDEPPSHSNLSQELGVSKERIKQLERKVAAKVNQAIQEILADPLIDRQPVEAQMEAEPEN